MMMIGRPLRGVEDRRQDLSFTKMGRRTYWQRPGPSIACGPLGDANRGMCPLAMYAAVSKSEKARRAYPPERRVFSFSENY
jgi:hypothetical protein